MSRAELIEAIRLVLATAGYAVSERCDLRPVSFDLVARRDRELLIVKALHNVDALGEDIAHEIKVLSKYLDAKPLMVGERAGTGPLEDGVVYARHDIPIVTLASLEDYLMRAADPMVFAAPGGLYVHLDAPSLRRVRSEHGLSLGALAQIVGVSRRAIQMYEEGMNASIDAAVRLEEFFQEELIRPIDPFGLFDAPAFEPTRRGEETDPIEQAITNLLQGLGYQVQATRRSPFQALSGHPDADTMLTGIGRESPQSGRRARIITEVSRIIERPGFFVMEKTTRTEIEGLPVLSREELKGTTDADRILELLLDRRPRQAR